MAREQGDLPHAARDGRRRRADRRRAGRLALRRGPARRRADPPARLSRPRRGAGGDGGRPRARGEPRGGRAPDPRLDRGSLHRHLRAGARALARRRRGRRVPTTCRSTRRSSDSRSTQRRHRRTRGSGCGGSEGRPLHRGLRARPRALRRRRRAADRQPARAHRRAPLRRPAARLDPPGRLFVTTDHYVVRMLYSQGVPLERAGLRRATERARSTTAPCGSCSPTTCTCSR